MAYIDKYGVEFSEDRETLIKCPKNLSGGYMIPEGVKKISGSFWYDKRGYHSGGFEDNECIETIIIPASVTEIDHTAFRGTLSLKNIYVDGKNENFCSKDGILYNKDKTELIWCPEQYFGPLNLDNSVKIIDDSVGNSMIDSIYITDKSDYYTLIDGILYDKKRSKLIVCPKFKYDTVKIPIGIKEIGSNAFRNCLALKTVIIPNSVTRIGTMAFCGCTALKNVKLPDAQTTIGPWCFQDCTAISEIAIPSKVRFEEGGGALEVNLYGTFSNCTGLSKIIFLEGREVINGLCADESLFQNCTSIRTISFPKSLKELEVQCLEESISKVLVPMGEKKRFMQMLNCEEESIRKYIRVMGITKEKESYLRKIQKFKDCIEEVKQ